MSLLRRHARWGSVLLAVGWGCALEAQPADPVAAGAAGMAGNPSQAGRDATGSGGAGGKAATGSGGSGGSTGGSSGGTDGEGGAGATVAIDPCDPNPCGVGTCAASGENANCSCPDGYAGDYCELAVDECADEPCENGTCLDRVGGFECDCGSSGYTGDRCETQIEGCAETPCDNGGICSDSGGSRTCDCTGTGATGASCEVDTDECEARPCAHGTCTNGKNEFFCDCTGTGYTGANCGADVNECDGSPCDPLTTCTNADGGFSCSDCPQGYTGTGLTGCRDIDECATNNGGCGPADCTNVGGGRMCGNCPSGYYISNDGECVDDDECRTNPCRNGGTCTNVAGSFTCSCVTSFYGNTCERARFEIDATAHGYYSSHPSYPANGAVQAGFCASCSGATFRSFFAFPIPDFDGTVTGVQFAFFPTYESPDSAETFGVYEVTTPFSTLSALSGNQAQVYADLGDGTWYQMFTLYPGLSQTVVSYPLNGNAATAILAARGSHFAIGVSLTSYSGQTSAEEWAKLSEGFDPRVARLSFLVNAQ